MGVTYAGLRNENDGDGGYAILDYKLDQIEVVYGVGINTDIAVEEHLLHINP
jgi:hypothetical protein